jgi:trimeric autotransporter adhesin
MRLFFEVSRAAIVLTALSVATPGYATNCLLDTNQDGTATAGTDTAGGANSGGSVGAPITARLACGDGAVAGGVATALGPRSSATGDDATAVGAFANAPGVDSVSVGFGALASGTSPDRQSGGSVAVGAGARATSVRSIALGNGANATHNNSTAVGALATTTRDNQVMLGSTGTSVNIADIAASDAAQVGPEFLLTVDSSGTMGRGSQVATISDLQTQQALVDDQLETLQRRANGADGGIAAAMAMGGMMVVPNSRVTLNFNLATYRGEQGFAGGVVGRLAPRVYVNAVVAGSSQKKSAGGRIGIAFGL